MLCGGHAIGGANPNTRERAKVHYVLGEEDMGLFDRLIRVQMQPGLSF